MMPVNDGILSVMMPIYNEEKTLAVILGHVLIRREVGEVIAVDDCSTDRSWEILQEIARTDSRVRPVRQEINQGKGAALRRAIKELSLPYALVQDADLEYDPRDYPILVGPLVEGRSDVVFGARGFAGQTAYSFWFVMGNKLVTLATNVLFNTYLSDMETGYKALRSDLWTRLCLDGKRFAIEPDITSRVLRLGYRIHEVPISYYARSRAEGKKLTWLDGVRAVAALTSRRLRSRTSLFGQRSDPAYHRDRQETLASRHPLREATDAGAAERESQQIAKAGVALGVGPGRRRQRQ